MNKFWDLLEQSVIVQAMVTLALVGACVILVILEREIPDALLNMTLVTLGFYFGAKGQLNAKQAARAAVQEIENGKTGGGEW